MKAFCDASCQQSFELEDFQTVRIGDGVDKVYFVCPHCKQEYVAFYTNPEIRKLQAKIRNVLGRTVDPRASLTEAIKQEKKIQKQIAKIKSEIKEKMDVLRARIEGKETSS
ncbi:hypothetical protein [Paenibacillus lutimineralis]|uniref:Transglycosylase n=1 Tax=Paenibacillus lutimineralis TaxID=2707005 RepID=A0A3Q9IAS5_9BACL|nr:hypothetical protein [Paenibacillus lutimineralis]AZS16465.1 hypothetical protein EI981_19760 [Paenibacillus lutimineralis]